MSSILAIKSLDMDLSTDSSGLDFPPNSPLFLSRKRFIAMSWEGLERVEELMLFLWKVAS